ncbi:type IV pilin protein [Solicola sp. PLA-1-18]|uniref:type IV pilin protein n=1 Tax=Solicola sp. PLA-1-18 TaxID=3380532 RepID=UPI003B797820
MINRLAELRRKKENGEGGFTLIELLVVVVIIGILMAIAVPLYLNYRKGANDKAAQSDVRAAISTLEQCNSDNAAYPTAVATTGGTPTGCANGKITKSDATGDIVYTPVTDGYRIYAKATSGNGNFYCYLSTAGGSVKTLTAAPTGTTC